MPYCMYLRKSRADLEAEARGEGETLARHFQTLMLLADRLGLDIAPSAVYREIVSGDTIAARPMMQRLLQEVQDGKWEGVLCTEVERLARGDTIDQGLVAQAFKYSNTRIITPAKTYDPRNEMDEEYFEFSLFMARREYKSIKRRMQAGRAASVREGHYVGGKRPFGYQVVRCKGKGYTLQQIPEEARIVRQVFDWYLSGIGASTIARRLNAMGSSTCNGNPWQAYSIRHMLSLPIYAGYVQWLKREGKKSYSDGEIVTSRPFSDRYILAPGLHEPIVTQQEFDRAREIAIQRRTISHIENGHISSPLAGLCRCGLCGYALRRRPNAGNVFLVCSNVTCNFSSMLMDTAVSLLLDTLKSWLIRYSGPQAQQPTPPVLPDRSADVSIVTAAMETAQRQLTTAQDMLERGVYSIDEYLERRHVLSEKIAAAKAELARLQADAASVPYDPECDIIRILPQVRRVLDSWPYAQTAADQNALLRSILSSATYTKTARRQRNDDPRAGISLILSPLRTPTSK